MCRFLRPPSRGAAGRAICQVPPPLAPVQPVRPHPPLTDDRPRRAVREPPTMSAESSGPLVLFVGAAGFFVLAGAYPRCWRRSEEHTSELQSRGHLVCRLLLEKKKNKHILVAANMHYIVHASITITKH